MPPLALALDLVQRACALAARGKRGSREVARFLLDGAAACRRLRDELTAGAWRPGEPRRFWIHEPKRQLISTLPFHNHIIQHLLIAQTLPSLERSFAPQSYACRRGKGTHRCLARAQELFRVRRFVLRLDLAKFFPSIDHASLTQLLAPHTPEAWWPITQAILSAPAHVEPTRFHFPGDDLFAPEAHPHGLPIGNLTSQVWANLMLTPIDHLIASQLGIGAFVRYCDDLLVFDDDAGRLHDAWDAIRDRCERLRLRLHPTKCRLHRTTERVSFLGFVLQRTGDAVRVRLRQENVRQFRARMREVCLLYELGAMDPAEVTSRVRAWLAHARHGHTRELCRQTLAELGFTRATLE